MKKLLLVLTIILFVPTVLGFGLAPIQKSTYDFQDSYQIKIINNAQHKFIANISAYGKLSDYISFNATQIHFNESDIDKKIQVYLDIPINTPFNNTEVIYINVLKLKNVSGTISATTTLIHDLTINQDLNIGGFGGGPYTIQDRINMASPGDELIIESGEYIENLVVNKNLILRSNESATINGTIQVRSDNVLIEGFTINSLVSTDSAIDFYGVNNISIHNNTFNGYRGLRFDIGTRDDSQINVLNNTFNTYYGITQTEEVKDLHIQGNNFQTINEAIGLGQDVSLSTEINTVEELFNQNSFNLVSGYSIGDYREFGYPLQTKYLALNTILVEEDDSIQNAIDSSSSGFTILVSDGVYEEDPIISSIQNLTLSNLENHNPTIRGELRIQSNSNYTNINNLIFEDNTKNLQAIRISSSSNVNINNNEFIGFRNHIQLDVAGGTPTNITLLNNLFEDANDSGTSIAGTEDVSGLTIINNTFNNNRNSIGLGVGVSNILIENNTFTNGVFYVTNRESSLDVIDYLLKLNLFDNAIGVYETNPAIMGNINQWITTSIQTGIDTASPNSLITISKGVYEETLTISTDNLTIIGLNDVIINSSNLAGISGAGSVNSANWITGNNIAINNIDFLGDQTLRGLTVLGENFTLLNSNVEFMRNTGINLFDATGANILNVSVHNTNGVGILVKGINVTLENITTSNNNWGGIGVSNDGSYLYNISSVKVIGSNNISDFLYIESDGEMLSYGFNDSVNVQVQETDFSYLVGGTPQDSLDQVYLRPTLESAILTAQNISPHIENMFVKEIAKTIFYVSEGMSIQSAINAASSESLIFIDEGTYNEEVSINKKGIILQSLQGAEVTIITSSTTNQEGVVAIESSNVTLEGFTINNQNAGDGRAVRIKDNSNNITITNNIFKESFRAIQGNWPGNNLVGLNINNNLLSTEYGVAGTENFENVEIIHNTFNTTSEGIGIATDSILIANNSFIASSGSHFEVYHKPTNFNVSPNWYNTLSHSVIKPRIIGNVTFEPYCLDEECQSLSELNQILTIGEDVDSLFADDTYFNISGDFSNASNLTSNQNITILVTKDNVTSKVLLPQNTKINRLDGQQINTSDIVAQLQNISSFVNVDDQPSIAVLKWGLTGTNLVFSNNITIELFVGSNYNGQTLQIRRSTSGLDGDWNTAGLVQTTCVASEGLCIFQTTRASFFAATATPASAPTTTGSGGSGGGTFGQVSLTTTEPEEIEPQEEIVEESQDEITTIVDETDLVEETDDRLDIITEVQETQTFLPTGLVTAFNPTENRNYLWVLLIIVLLVGVTYYRTQTIAGLSKRSVKLHKKANNLNIKGEYAKASSLRKKANNLQQKADNKKY